MVEQGADISLDEMDVWRLWVSGDGGEIDTVDLGCRVAGSEVARYDAGTAADVDEVTWILQGDVDNAVVHHFRKSRGLVF